MVAGILTFWIPDSGTKTVEAFLQSTNEIPMVNASAPVQRFQHGWVRVRQGTTQNPSMDLIQLFLGAGKSPRFLMEIVHGTNHGF